MGWVEDAELDGGNVSGVWWDVAGRVEIRHWYLDVDGAHFVRSCVVREGRYGADFFPIGCHLCVLSFGRGCVKMRLRESLNGLSHGQEQNGFELKVREGGLLHQGIE